MHHWLNQYGAKYHQWRQVHRDGQLQVYRPFGLVESSFDADGTHYEGRADINALLDIEVRTELSESQFKNRILLAWTVLRLNHALLMAKAVDRQSYMTVNDESSHRVFVINFPHSPQDAINEAAKDLVFAQEQHKHIDRAEFFHHAQNTGRVVDATRNLAKVFVLPMEKISPQTSRLRFLFVMGHQITDGLTNFTWLSHFVKLLNTPFAQLQNAITAQSTIPQFQSRLPLPQEDLYPPILGSKAKQRWFWLLNIVLRHVKKPQPAAFQNPLYRPTPRTSPPRLPPTYSKLLDYSRLPVLATNTVTVSISQSCTQRLHRLCREANTSIGAGCFVLVAMTMMSLHETQHPSIPLSSRLPFIGSFPLNPRQFFNHTSAPDSLMLAFSDGVVLPFLPSSLPFEPRFRLLARQAHRQLSLYQKRPRASSSVSGEAEQKEFMSSKGAGRLIAMNYIAAVERKHNNTPPHARHPSSRNPQGDLPIQSNPTRATCGVSSVGKSGWKIGEFDLEAEFPPSLDGEDAFRGDFRGLLQNVRAREGEFLVGIGGDERSIGANVSFDADAVDEGLVDEWKRRMECMLEVDGGEGRARL